MEGFGFDVVVDAVTTRARRKPTLRQTAGHPLCARRSPAARGQTPPGASGSSPPPSGTPESPRSTNPAAPHAADHAASGPRRARPRHAGDVGYTKCVPCCPGAGVCAARAATTRSPRRSRSRAPRRNHGRRTALLQMFVITALWPSRPRPSLSRSVGESASGCCDPAAARAGASRRTRGSRG